MENADNGKKLITTFVLTRGYQGLQKLKYAYIVRRNRSIRKNLSISNAVHHIIFHEGNISNFDQYMLKRLSGLELQFVDVSSVFKPSMKHKIDWTTAPGLGYRLMCRFQYQQVWEFLREYDVAIRIDEDCYIGSLSNLIPKQIMSVGYICGESHKITNMTLPRELSKLNMESYYDHKFPYTNLFVTEVAFWLRADVQKFLEQIGEDPEALSNRWGDLPILGVALKAFGKWDYREGLDKSIKYTHMSHRARISEGEYEEAQSDKTTRMFEIFGKFRSFLNQK